MKYTRVGVSGGRERTSWYPPFPSRRQGSTTCSLAAMHVSACLGVMKHIVHARTSNLMIFEHKECAPCILSDICGGWKRQRWTAQSLVSTPQSSLQRQTTNVFFSHTRVHARRNKRESFNEKEDPVYDDQMYEDDLDMWMNRLKSYPNPSARSVALEQLIRVDEGGAYAGLVSGSPDTRTESTTVDVLDQPDASIAVRRSTEVLDPQERRQVTEIVSGVIRWQRRLHWMLEHLPKPTKLDTMDTPLRILLYMGTYELLELNMASHAINEYVNLAKYVMHEGCGNVANGALRSIARARDGTDGRGIPVPPKPKQGMTKGQVANALGIMYSHPTWMIYRWLGLFGPSQTVALLNRNNSRPSFSIRLSDVTETMDAIENMGARVKPSVFLPEDYVVVESGLQNIIASGLLKAGKAQVQDEAAGMVVKMLMPQPGDSVLDCCAAPGGKAIVAAARMEGQGSILALDSVDSRTRAVENAAKKYGYDTMIRCITSDARQFCENAALSGDVFDKVMVDAPCSGTGVLAKRADMRWRRKETDISTLVSLQKQLLSSASKVVRVGGYLVYSTCSIEREENQGIVQAFLETHENFELIPGSTSPDNDIPDTCLDDMGCLQMIPHIHNTDGAFAARFKRIL